MPAITLSRPAQGQIVTISATDKNAKITLGFSTDGVTLSRGGNTLIFTFEDEAVIRIDDFYTSYHSDNIPEFEIDGKLVSGAEFFSVLGPDLIPAAGPSPAERAARYTEHDNADLASGIDHLGSLDYSTESSGFHDAALRMGGAEVAAAPSASEGAGGGSGGQEPSPTYHTRLVVTATSANTFSFFAVDEDGNLVNDPNQISSLGFEGASTYFIITGIAADGRITVELTAAGLAALNNGTLASDMLLISVDGVEYKMPLLITGGSAGQSYDAAAEENRAQLGGELKAEWYASDARTVNGENITLGGTGYNQVDIDRSDTGGAGNIGVRNSNIDITAAAKGAVNITALHNTGSAYGLATYENSGQVSSSVRGGEESAIHISAQTTGTAGTAWAVYTNSNQGANAATTVEGGDITIEAHGNEAGAYGVYAWAAGGREASTTVKAAHDLTITADSSMGSSNGYGNTAVHATGGGAKITISSGPDGKLQVASHLENSTQEHFNVEKNGFFAASGISAYNGGQVSATGADINIASDVKDSSAHGTATAVYAGYGNARTTINGYADRDNHMEFSSSAPDHAITVIGTNSGVVTINGGSGDDIIKISSEAKFGSSFGVAAQASGQVLINGNGGHDELHIDARFNGPAKPGTTELFDGNRGAYGMASAWGGAWVKVDGIETVNITADARGSGGSAYGMYTRGNGWGAADGNIIQHDGSLHATISGYADNPVNGHAMHASGGENIIQGGSRLGDADGDRITLNGHMTAAGYNGKNLVTTGDGDDIVTLNGNMAIKNIANDGMQNKIETGLGNDVVRVSGNMITDRASGQNIINVGAGDNLVEIGGDMRGVGTNSVILGSGDSTVNLGGKMSASGVKGVNSIQGDASGNTVVNVNGQGAALYATAGGKNSISGVHDVHADSGYIYATGSGSSNRITDIAGAVTTTMLAADDSGSNAVTNVGSLDIQAAGSGATGIYAGENASNFVDANGGININAQSSSSGTWGLMAGALGGNATNSLKAGADINITATGSGTSADAIDNNSGNTTHVESTGGDVTLKAASTSNAAQGIWGIGSTTVIAGKNLTIEASTQGNSEARGVHTGGTTTLTAQDGDVTVRAEGDMASGLYTVSTGTTTVSASGLVDIQAHGTSGSYYIHGGNATALYAESRNTGQLARNIIEGGEVSITAKTLQSGGTYALYNNTALNRITGDTQVTVAAENSGTGNAWGMYATATNNKLGTNEITGHDVTVSSSAANGNAYAMQASSSQGDSANTVILSGGAANISAASAQGSAYAMHAEGHGTNTITGNGDVNVFAHSGSNEGYGMYATSSGSNTIQTVDGNVTVTGKSSQTGLGMASAWATPGGSNTITTESGNVHVAGEGNTHGAFGMLASNYNNSNSITTNSGDVTVTGKSSQYAYGMHASGGLGSKNTITTESGNVHVACEGSANAGLAMYAGGSGGNGSISNNSITTGSGDVTVTGSSSGSQGGGMTAQNYGGNRIATMSGSVTVTGSGKAGYGMRAESSGTNTITTKNGDVEVTGNGIGTGNQGYGMAASGPGDNKIETVDGNVTVSGTGNGFGYGMMAESSGNSTITTKNGDVEVTGNGYGAGGGGGGYGMYAKNSGSTTIETVDGKVTVAGESTNRDGYGMYATSSGSKNTITTNNGDVEVNGSKYGMYATSSGSNEIKTAGGNVEISGSSGGHAWGMYANASGSNSVTTTSGDVKVTGSGKAKIVDNDITGMHATAGSNSIKTESGSVSVTGNQRGMFAESSGSNAIITDSGNVTVSANNSNSDSNYGDDYGMYAISSGSNRIMTESGNVTVASTNSAKNSYGMTAEGSGSNSIITDSGNVTVSGKSSISGNNHPTCDGHGMYATSSGSNSITTESGDVKVSGSAASGDSVGMKAEFSGSNSIITDSGDVTVTGKSTGNSTGNSSTGMFASSSGSNTITTASGTVRVEARDGLVASYSGKNVITAHDGGIVVKGDWHGTGGSASSLGSNTITATGSATVNIINNSAGLLAQSGGVNTVSATDGKIYIEATNTGLQASDAGSSNVITGKDIGITARTSSSDALLATSGGKNSVISVDGNVALAGGNVLRATGTGSENRLAVDNGSIAFKSWSSGINWAAGNPLLYYTDTAAHASSNGRNIITGTGGTDISFTGQGFGLRADSGGSNSVTTDGDVTFSGITQALAANGATSANTLNASNIFIDSKVYADRSVATVNAETGGHNTLTASSDGAITITTAAATGSERDPYSTSINDTASVRADGAGSHNTLSAGEISIDNQCGKGLAATDGGVNTLESAQGSPLTVTITASADTAEKAIAMWASGGGSVNYITGHSQAGGTGDSITLTANNGQGTAMQTENGGRNIITTGAGDDRVFINGNIVGDGNEINLGGGSNVLTINGMVQPGSLNVIATGGTYTLILQAADTQGFIAQYGGWLDAVRASFLFSGGLEAINFEGLSGSNLAEFLDVFNDVLWYLKDKLVDIQPPELVTQLHDPAAPFAAPLAAALAETGADHHTQGVQHADGEDAAQNSAQDPTLAAHHGPALLTDDGLNTGFNAQADNTGAHMNVPGPDATAQTGFADEEEQIQPIFAFLDDHAADMPAGVAFEEGDDALHNGYLGNEGENSGDFAVLHAPITLTYGDESLDNLFAATSGQDPEKSGADIAGGELHDMGLTDMNAAPDQSLITGPAAANGPAAAAEGVAAAVSEVSAIPSVMDSCQEATDSAAREMTTC